MQADLGRGCSRRASEPRPARAGSEGHSGRPGIDLPRSCQDREPAVDRPLHHGVEHHAFRGERGVAGCGRGRAEGDGVGAARPCHQRSAARQRGQRHDVSSEAARPANLEVAHRQRPAGERVGEQILIGPPRFGGDGLGMHHPLAPTAAGKHCGGGAIRREKHHLPTAVDEGLHELGIAAFGQRRLPEQRRGRVPRGRRQAARRDHVDAGRPLVRGDSGDQLQHACGRRVVGDHECPPRRRVVVHEIELVVGGIGVGGNRHAAEALALGRTRERNHVVLQHRLAAGEFHIDGTGDAADLDLEGQREPLAIFLPRHRDGDDEPSIPAEGLEPHAADADGHVAPRRLGIRHELEADRLRKFCKRIADAPPAAVVGPPVIGPLVGADPDLGGARRVLTNEVVGRLEHPWHVGGGGRRPARRQFGERLGGGHLLRPPRRVADHQHPPGAERGERFGKLPAASVEFRFATRRRGAGLHARAPVEHHDCRVGPAAAGEGQPAPRERSAHGQDHGGDRQHPQQHDQPVPQPRIAPRERLGRQQKLHRGPRHRLKSPLVDQVNDQRQSHQRQRDEHPRLQEGHRSPLPAARPTRNRASTCS